MIDVLSQSCNYVFDVVAWADGVVLRMFWIPRHVKSGHVVDVQFYPTSSLGPQVRAANP